MATELQIHPIHYCRLLRLSDSRRPGIAWLVLDDPAKKVNTLSTRLFGWFEEQVSRLERERPSGLVILSGKADGFVAGADLFHRN